MAKANEFSNAAYVSILPKQTLQFTPAVLR